MDFFFKNMKEQRERRDQFSKGPLADSLPSAALAGHAVGSVLQQSGSYGVDNESVAIEMGSFGNSNYTSQMQVVEKQVHCRLYFVYLYSYISILYVIYVFHIYYIFYILFCL